MSFEVLRGEAKWLRAACLESDTETRVQTLALPLSSRVTLGKLHKLSNLQFSHRPNGANNSACPGWLLWELPVLHIKGLAQGLTKI